MEVDLSVPMTQAEFGDLVGISRQAVGDFVRREILVDGASADEWLLAYCDHLRVIAAGRGGDKALELTAERARLASEQADRIAMQNALARKEQMPTYLLEEILARASSRAGRILDTIAGELRRRLPQLSSADLAHVNAIVAKARNAAAKVSLADLDADLDAPLDDVIDVGDEQDAA